MEFKEYLVSYSCYPRCQHAYKYLKQLSDRYDDLIKTDKTNRVTTKSEFSLCLQSVQKGQIQEITNALKRNEKVCYLETIKCTHFKELLCRKGKAKEMYFVFVTNKKVSKYDIPQSDKVKIIFIAADDGRDRDKAIELYNDTQNIHISMKEHLSDQISDIMERCLFNDFEMKRKCEQLLKTVSNIPAEIDVRQEKSTFISNDESYAHFENKNSPPQRSKSDEYIIQRDNALERKPHTKRSISLYDPCQKDKSTMTVERASEPEAVKKKWNKDMNMPFEKGNKTHNAEDSIDGRTEILLKEDIERTERLYDEIMGMFNRSRVPKEERPQLDKRFDGTVTDELKQDLRGLSPYIRSCGYRCRSFVVFVDGEFNPELLKPGLEKIMKKHNISMFTIVPSSVKQFSSCNVGSKIAAEFDKDTIKLGTLGGFGLASSYKEGKTGALSLTSLDKESKTIGLVSRHVVTVGNIPASILRVGSEEQPIEASVLVNNSFSDRENVLDIAAASFGHNKDNLDTRYKTSEERAVPGRLTDYSPEEMQGLHVHICGSTTPIGYGTVTMPKIEAIRDRYMDGHYIIIEDRESHGTEKKSFCKEGDSGAIVCADDQENPEEVQLISMVMGENAKIPGSYYSLNLKNGIQQVEEETKSNIKLL